MEPWGSQHMETGRKGARKEAKEEQPGRQEENQKLVKPGGMSRSERQGETTCAKVRGQVRGRGWALDLAAWG